MKLVFVSCLLFLFSCAVYSQQSREEKLVQLKSRTDIKVTEIEKDILRIEYPHGKVLYKNIGDYNPQTTDNKLNYSPTFDSTIIDLTTIDTSLYYHKYSFWQEVPIHNWSFDYIRIGDVNNNGKPELYGPRKLFNADYEPVTVYEINEQGIFNSIYQYDSIYITRNIYDLDNDGELEVILLGLLYDERFFFKESDSSLAILPKISFNPFVFPTQLDDPTLGDFDGDGYTDLLFDRNSPSYVYIFEYNPIINQFDSVYRFQVPDPTDLGIGGYSIGDFDLDGKTDIVFSTVQGKVFVIENEDDNLYTDVWQGNVESNNAYVHTWTNDIDKNGKPEFWVLADTYFNGMGTTRITIFETDGDNSYQAVGRVDLVGVFSFYAGNMQAIDIDGDGTEEVAICIDGNFLIIKFNGSENHQSYEVYYVKKNELNSLNEFQEYFGSIMYALEKDGEYDILISMAHTIMEPSFASRGVTKIYKPDSITSVMDDPLLPNEFELYQSYPNPFNPSTNIKFNLSKREDVSIKIYNVLGKEIKLQLQENLPSGEHKVQWNGTDNKGNTLPGGVYFIQMTAGEYRQTIKTVLLK
ncbi:MAG: FlgD immunoglobulin-like domain containing protein [Ignavibacteriaceae bacterium]